MCAHTATCSTSHPSTVTRQACDAMPGMSQLSRLPRVLSRVSRREVLCLLCARAGCAAGGPHRISCHSCCRPAQAPECPDSLPTLSGLSTAESWHGPMRGQLYSEEGPRDAQLLLPGQVTWSGRVELSSLAHLWHFAPAVHTKTGKSLFCVFSSVAKNLEAEARGH